MNEQAEILVDEMAKMSTKQKEINAFKTIALCALDIICGMMQKFVLFYTFLNKFIYNFYAI